MRLKTILSTLLLSNLTLLSFGQNLVPNGDFESSAKRPRFMSSSDQDFKTAIHYWSCPNQASTDLITTRFDSKNLTVVPPHSGEQMIGIVVNGDYWAEYGKVKLKEPIEKGKTYYIEYWISMPTYYSKKEPKPTALNDHFGLYFSKDIYKFDKRILTAKPDVPASNKDIARPVKWHKIKSKFTATKDATHLYIGQFLDEKDASKIAEGYFLIDDVFIEAYTRTSFDYEPSRYYTIKGKTASVNIDNIYFETDKYELLQESYKELDNLVGILNNNPTLKIEIQGHTDDVGSAEHNKELSYNRAKTVYDYLNNSGIDAERLRFSGYGISKPVAENNTESGRQQNRRVDFVVEASPELEDSREMMAPEYIYKFSNDIPSDKKARHSFIGKHINTWDCDTRNPEKANIVDATMLRKSRVEDAKSYIVKKAKKEKALFFNEYAQHAQNRAFLAEILQDLFDAGYTYLCLEDLTVSDKEINIREHAVINSGYYIKHPVYGDLIRKAFEIGFEMVSYEPTRTQLEKAQQIVKRKATYDNPDWLKQSAKNWSRAMNLSQVFRKNPSAKAIILTSRGDVKEIDSEGFNSMATWFKNFTKIAPYTIDQRSMTEKCKAEEHPLYSLRSVNKPSIFIHKEKPFVAKETNPIDGQTGRFFDLQVYFPRSKYPNQRPNWLSMNGYRKATTINPNKYGLKTPCMIMAFKKGEDMSFAVPVDAIEYANSNAKTPLMLPTGQYTILLNDGNQLKKVDWSVE